MKKVIEKIKDILLRGIDKLKLLLSKYLVASDSDPEAVRTKHIRVGVVLFVIFVTSCIGILVVSDSSSKKDATITIKKEKIADNASGIKELAKGVSNEQTWTEIRGKEVDEIRSKQSEFDSKQSELETKVINEKVSKEEVAELVKKIKENAAKLYPNNPKAMEEYMKYYMNKKIEF